MRFSTVALAKFLLFAKLAESVAYDHDGIIPLTELEDNSRGALLESSSIIWADRAATDLRRTSADKLLRPIRGRR